MSTDRQHSASDGAARAEVGLSEQATQPPAPPASAETAPGAAGEAGTAEDRTSVQIPGYEVLGELGRGGMGVVYRAVQVGLKRPVAIKMILGGHYAGMEALARFKAEGEALARLRHPNVVQIYDLGAQEGKPYFVLEFVDGGSLADRLKGEPWEPAAAAALGATLARAVHAVHAQGIIHRDLKPANVLLTPDGQPKITDFGLAKQRDAATALTASGAVLGTPSYMAPEQAGGSRKRVVGPAADVYALGAILYHLLTGRPPFEAETPLDTILQVVSEDPAPPRSLRAQIPRDLETICLKCLHKDPQLRYGSAQELAEDLERFQRREPIRGRRMSLAMAALRLASRHPTVTAVAACVAGQSLLFRVWTAMDDQTLSLVGGTVLSLITHVLSTVAVIRFVFTPPAVRKRVRRGLLLLAAFVLLEVAAKYLFQLVHELSQGGRWFFFAWAACISGPLEGVITGLCCGFISVCARRWLGGTLRATAAGSIVGLFGMIFGFVAIVQWLFENPSDLLLPIGLVSSLLVGPVLGAYLGAVWSRRRAIS